MAAAVIFYITRNRAPLREDSPRPPRIQPLNAYPGVLWILPVLYGIVGGTVAALIAGMKYNANWWPLLLVGFAVTAFIILIPFLIFGAAMFSLLTP